MQRRAVFLGTLVGLIAALARRASAEPQTSADTPELEAPPGEADAADTILNPRVGKVGIGIEVPVAKLHIVATGSGRALEVGEVGGGGDVLVHGSTSLMGAAMVDRNLDVTGKIKSSSPLMTVQTHPTRPGQVILYHGVTSGVASTTISGKATLSATGRATVSLPEHFGLMTGTTGLTVQLTPIGASLQLFSVSVSPTQLVVREANGRSGDFFYRVEGVLKSAARTAVILNRTEVEEMFDLTAELAETTDGTALDR